MSKTQISFSAQNHFSFWKKGLYIIFFFVMFTIPTAVKTSHTLKSHDNMCGKTKRTDLCSHLLSFVLLAVAVTRYVFLL